MITWFKTHRLLTIVFSIIILHFIITSFIGHYISIQIGTQLGQTVGENIVEAFESPDLSDEDANRIYQNMKNDSDNIIAKWKVPMVLLSLPSKPLTWPLYKKIIKIWLYDPLRSRTISLDQFKKRGMILGNINNGFNSLSFGLLVYLALIFINKYKSKHNKPLERDVK